MAVPVEESEAAIVAANLEICPCPLQLPLLLGSLQALQVQVVRVTHTVHQLVLHLSRPLDLSRSPEIPLTLVV